MSFRCGWRGANNANPFAASEREAPPTTGQSDTCTSARPCEMHPLVLGKAITGLGRLPLMGQPTHAAGTSWASCPTR